MITYLGYCWNCCPAGLRCHQEPERPPLPGPPSLSQGRGTGLGNSWDPQIACSVLGNSTGYGSQEPSQELSESEALAVKWIPYQKLELKTPSKVKGLSKPWIHILERLNNPIGRWLRHNQHERSFPQTILFTPSSSPPLRKGQKASKLPSTMHGIKLRVTWSRP